MSKTSYLMVHYHQNQRANWDGTSPTLEQICRSALSKKDASDLPLWERADARVYSFGDLEPKQILLNKVADLQSAVFGEMCLVQSKDLQAIIEMTAEKKQLSDLTMAEVYALAERAAPAGSQFLRGILYWLAIGDHVFFVKLGAMSSGMMQEYLNWLLASTSSLAVGKTVALLAQFDPSGGDIGQVKSLRVSGKTAPKMTVTPVQDATVATVKTTSRRIKDAIRESEMARPILVALFGEERTESFQESLGEGEYLSVDATVKIKGRRTEESKRKIRELANALDDMSDTDVQIEGKDGTLKDGDAILRTKMPFSVPHEGSTILDFDNVADQLQTVYRRFVEDGKIRS
jgi:hypothetical protein